MNNRHTASLLGCLLNLAVIWVLNAQLVPGINESHYLPKAKHAWNPSFAPGDLFLESGNAHWLFAQMAGALSLLVPLAGVAWIGRMLAWLAMAFAWQRLAVALRLPIVVSALALAGSLLATRMGNWAGEWAVGGFEAKSLAYPWVVLALAQVVRHRWSSAWIPLGIATAFHPLVGGWAGLTILGAWCCLGRQQAPLAGQWPQLTIAAALAMVGLVPAVAMIGGPSRSGEIVVAQIHAFFRLAHHQSPRLFHWHQHVAGAISLAILGGITLALYGQSSQRLKAVRLAQQPSVEAAGSSAASVSSGSLMVVAWCSVGLCLCGVLIDTLGVWIRPDVAAGLLRFYWFRWADVIVPLAWVIGAWHLALSCMPSYYGRHASLSAAAGTSPANWLPAAGLSLLTVGMMAWQISGNWHSPIAPADRTILMADSSDKASGPEVVDDWIAACNWIAANTPSDALFLTPRAQQTFKWYAARAEVVTFKDVPQDSQSLLEWYDRIGRCAPPRAPDGKPLGWTTPQIKRLHARYGFDYLLVDRRIQTAPPLLEIVYPLGTEQNRTYAIFKLPKSATH